MVFLHFSTRQWKGFVDVKFIHGVWWRCRLWIQIIEVCVKSSFNIQWLVESKSIKQRGNITIYHRIHLDLSSCRRPYSYKETNSSMQISVFRVIATNHHVMHVTERLIVSEFMPMSQTRLCLCLCLKTKQKFLLVATRKEREMKSNNKVRIIIQGSPRFCWRTPSCSRNTILYCRLD